MATAEDAENGDAGSGDQYVTQADYEEQTRETQTIALSTGGLMDVEVTKPLEVVKAAQQYGVQSILNQDDGIDKQELVGDGDDTGIGPFMEYFVAPKIVRPKAYWYDPDPSDVDFDPSQAFDLSKLDEGDMGAVVRGIMGQDADEDGGPTESGNGTTSGGTE